MQCNVIVAIIATSTTQQLIKEKLMQALTIAHLEKFEAKLIDVESAYNLSGRKDFDIAYDKNLSVDRLTLDEVEFKKDLAELKEASTKKEAEYRISMSALKDAITEARRQVKLDASIAMAIHLIS